jgi:hypothetical protein
MAVMKTYCVIWSATGAALGMLTSHGQAHAQTSGCVVVEVTVEDQFTQRWSPVVAKSPKENEPRGFGQQDATAPLTGVPLPRPREKQRDATDKDDPIVISAREKAFASGQSLVDYCNLKIETDTKR